ncbi:Uncharacterised protein [Mycobacterium tuberculosis]|nr:Uncharacterised protein [Mycobacterium tuberculosis]
MPTAPFAPPLRALAHRLGPTAPFAPPLRALAHRLVPTAPFAPPLRALAHRLVPTAPFAPPLRALAHRRGFQTTRAVLFGTTATSRRWLARNTANSSAISCNLDCSAST